MSDNMSQIMRDPTGRCISYIGKSSDGACISVDYTYFQRLYMALTTYTAWDNIVPQSHHIEFQFPMSDGNGVVHGKYSTQSEPSFYVDDIIDEFTLVCSIRQYCITLRFVKRRYIDQVCDTHEYTRVTLYETWMFQDHTNWRYIFSKQCTGESKEAACNTDPQYVIYIIFTGHMDESTTVETVTQNIIEKSIDLLGRYNSSGQLVTLPIALST